MVQLIISKYIKVIRIFHICVFHGKAIAVPCLLSDVEDSKQGTAIFFFSMLQSVIQSVITQYIFPTTY